MELPSFSYSASSTANLFFFFFFFLTNKATPHGTTPLPMSPTCVCTDICVTDSCAHTTCEYFYMYFECSLFFIMSDPSKTPMGILVNQLKDGKDSIAKTIRITDQIHLCPPLYLSLVFSSLFLSSSFSLSFPLSLSLYRSFKNIYIFHSLFLSPLSFTLQVPRG